MKHFQFQLRDDFIRPMNRSQYKEVSHWLRSVARSVEDMINWNDIHRRVMNMALGQSEDDKVETYGVSPCKAVLEDVKRVNKMDEVARIAGYAAFFREKNNEQT